AQWRADNADKVEPASVLIQRIAAERQSRYAAELAAWASGVSGNGRKPRPPQELSPLTPAELAELPALPEGWAWVKAEEISEFITKGTTPQKAELFSDGGEIPFIKVYNLTHNGSLDFSINPTFVSWNTHDSFLARSKVFPGDVLMNIVGPPLGKVSIVPSIYPEWNINQAIARFRSHFVSRKFLSNYLLFEGTIRTMMSKSKATAGQFNLTLEICREIPVPLCSQLEQSEIVKEIEARLSVVDQLEQTITDALQQAAALRQSILKKAFAGQLVPQDPNDEPAVALLARIRAAKASHDQR
ncbi:MAG: restriction endonuclease subunit S, partial [Chloroflexi bacterium]